MTVNTVSPAIISRAEFNLNAGQTKTPQLVRMDFGNLVTNGTFDTDTNWTKGAGWTITGGEAVATAASGTLNPDPYLNLGVGRRYTGGVTVVSVGAGTAQIVAYNQTPGSNLAFATTATPATMSLSFTAIGVVNQLYLWRSGGTDLTARFDNLTLYEADPSDDAPWLRLPYGYSVGRTGMIVRDGVVLHPSDYTEIKDSGQTWIKPLVSPGASTEFSIWGSPSYAV